MNIMTRPAEKHENMDRQCVFVCFFSSFDHIRIPIYMHGVAQELPTHSSSA